MSTLRKSQGGIWIQGVPRAGRLAKSQGLLVIMGRTRTGTLRKSQEQTVNTNNQVAIRVTDLTQRAFPNSYIAKVAGKLYGTGTYNPVNVSFVSLEMSESSSGPWTAVTPDTGDPDHVFPAQADADGNAYCLVVQPEIWTNTTLWFKLTVNFTGVGSRNDMGGAFTWNGADIIPGTPASVTVPSQSQSGDFTVSWAEVDGVTGYEYCEGASNNPLSPPGIWDSWVDVGDNLSVDIVNKRKWPSGYVYWYRVRAYNPANPGSYIESSNGCEIIPPDPPSGIVVPAESYTGTYTVSWSSSTYAENYELEESTDPGFSTTVSVYYGPNLSFELTGRPEGTYYYRVRAWGPGLESNWTEGPGGCEVKPPDPPASITVPVTSITGNYTVSWASSPYADEYELEEDTDPLFSAPVNIYTGPNLSFNLSGKTQGTYYYRVRAGSIIGFSDWVEGANGCRVERPEFRVTPDLGWANVDDMFNPLLNEKMVVFPLDQLETTELTPSSVMGRYNMVFSYGGTNYLIPGDQIGKFGSSGRHLWRYIADTVSAFTLAKEALNSGGVPFIPQSVQPRILR